MFLLKRIITQLNSSKLDTCTHTVMPASIEISNYYFHQISSFCCFNVLCCINHWWHLPITGDPVMTRSPVVLLRHFFSLWSLRAEAPLTRYCTVDGRQFSNTSAPSTVL